MKLFKIILRQHLLDCRHLGFITPLKSDTTFIHLEYKLLNNLSFHPFLLKSKFSIFCEEFIIVNYRSFIKQITHSTPTHSIKK